MSATQPLDVLLHVDDPGAANLIAPLMPLPDKAGISAQLSASSQVAPYLEALGAGYELLSGSPSDVLDATRPRLLVVGTSEDRHAACLALTDAARARGIVSLGAVDMIVNAENRFRGGGSDPLGHAPDWLAVPDGATAEAYRALGFAAERIVVCGHPHYDVVRARRAELEKLSRARLRAELLPEAPQDRPVLVFLAEGVDQLDPAASRIDADASLRGSGTSDDRTTVVLEEVLAAARELEPRPCTVLRLHPKNRPDDYAGVHGTIDHVSHGGDPLPLLWCADMVVGMTTFLLVEAYLLGRPCLSVLPRIEEARWLPTTAAGATPVATTRPALRAELGRLAAAAASGGTVVDDTLLPAGAGRRYLELMASLIAGRTHAAAIGAAAGTGTSQVGPSGWQAP